MSDMVTHWAAYEDCRRLAQLDEKLEPVFREVIESRRDVGRLGTLTRLGAKWMQPMLTTAMGQLKGGANNDVAKRNLAFVLGGLIHQATDNVMKPVLSNMSGANWTQMQASLRGTPNTPKVAEDAVERAHEYSAYLDAEVFREVYLDGDAEPLSHFFMGEMSAKGKSFEEFIRAIFQRSLLSAHTLNPTAATMDNMADWLDNLFRLVQPYFVDVDRWVRVYNHPDPKKVEEFGIRTEFYRKDDPTIRAARALQHGQPVDAATRKAVFEDGKYLCVYAQILQVGLMYMRSAAEFWRGESKDLIAPNFEQWPTV
jgi:hypothetical protein